MLQIEKFFLLLYKKVFLLQTLTQQFQKFSEQSQESFAVESGMVIGWWVGQVKLLKRNAS